MRSSKPLTVGQNPSAFAIHRGPAHTHRSVLRLANDVVTLEGDLESRRKAVRVLADSVGLATFDPLDEAFGPMPGPDHDQVRDRVESMAAEATTT